MRYSVLNGIKGSDSQGGEIETIDLFGVAAAVMCIATSAPAYADAYMKITLTGVQGGPPVFKGQAGAGTLVQDGDDEDDRGSVRLQFDTGRGTTRRLSPIGVPVGTIDAVFLTHLHSDHTDDLAEMMQLRWHFNSAGPKSISCACWEARRSCSISG